MPPFQSSGVHGAEFNTPQADGLIADGDAALSQEIFYISMAQIKTIVQPNGVGNDVGRESVALVGIHGPILQKSAI